MNISTNKSILDDIEIDDVNDENDIYDINLHFCFYQEPNDYLSRKFTNILSQSNFIDSFKKPEIDVHTIHVNFNSDNMSLEDLCILIQKMYTSCCYKVETDNNLILNCYYFFSSEKTNPNYVRDMYITNEDNFLSFFKHFFPNASDDEIFRTFLKYAIKYQNIHNEISINDWFEVGTNNNKEFFINKNGEILLDRFAEDAIRFNDNYGFIKFHNENWKEIDRNGNTIFVFPNDYYPLHTFIKKGYTQVVCNNNIIRNYNLLNNKTSELVFNKWYNDMGVFSEGYAYIMDENMSKNFIDINENTLFEKWFPANYNFSSFGNDYSIVTEINNNLMNLIDKNGNYISKKWFKCISRINDGLAVVRNDDDEENYIKQDGTFLLKRWRHKCYNFHEGVAFVTTVENQYRYSLIDITGKVIKNNILLHRNFKEGFAVIENDELLYNYIDKKGNRLSKKTWFNRCYEFNNGIARVEKDSKANFIDKTGKKLLPEWIDIQETIFENKDGFFFPNSGFSIDFNGNIIFSL